MTTWRDGWLAWLPAVKRRVCTAVWLCLLLISDAASVSAASVTPLTSLLNEAWQFASAITNDANDRARCQADVARAWLEAGQPERGIKAASQISDWRKLAITADAAAWWAERGQTNEATRALMEAEYLAPGIKDWPYDRVQMHLARAKAMLGRKADLLTLATTYRGNRDYSGAVQAALALEAARRGALDEAIACVEQITDQEHLDLISARASGFREVAASGKIPAGQLSNLLVRAWDSASVVPGWLKVTLQIELVDALCEADQKSIARTFLHTTTDALLTAPYPNHVRATQLADAAIRWGRLGETGLVARLEAESLALSRKSMELIEQPSVLALLAEARAAVGDTKRAAQLFDEAFDTAGRLINLRPRAIACVEVTLALARTGVDGNQFLNKRQALLEGFEDRGR